MSVSSIGTFVYTTPTPAFTVPDAKENAGKYSAIAALEDAAGNDNNLLAMMDSFETTGQALDIFV